MALAAAISSIFGAVLVVVVGGGGFLYITDYQLDATVTGTDCAHQSIDVQTKQLNIKHTMTDVPTQQCAALHPGNFVQYHVRTKHTVVFNVEGGKCIYDSLDPARCTANDFYTG